LFQKIYTRVEAEKASLDYNSVYIIFSCINKKNKSIPRALNSFGLFRALINLLSIKYIYNKFLINQSFRLYS
jgi:hypothetical protein